MLQNKLLKKLFSYEPEGKKLNVPTPKVRVSIAKSTAPSLPSSKEHKKTVRKFFVMYVFGLLACFGRIPRLLTFNILMPNDHYSGRTAPLTSKRFVLYIYSTNIGTEYFKHGIYSPFFSLQNAVCFIIRTYLVPVLFTFYIQSVLKFKK